MRRKSVEWCYCTESRLNIPTLQWEVSPSFLYVSEFGPRVDGEEKETKDTQSSDVLYPMKTLKIFWQRDTRLCGRQPPGYHLQLPTLLWSPPTFYQHWDSRSDGASPLRLGPNRGCSSAVSVSFSLMTCSGWSHYGGSSVEGSTWWGAKPPANSHMDNLGNGLPSTPDKPSDETIAQLVTWERWCLLDSNLLLVILFAAIFSHTVDCLFVLSVVSFPVQKLLNLIMSYFIFAFVSFALVDIYPRPPPPQNGCSLCQNVLPMFSPKSFKVSCLTCRCLIHFELTFVCDVRKDPNFICLLKRLSFPHCVFLLLLS